MHSGGVFTSKRIMKISKRINRFSHQGVEKAVIRVRILYTTKGNKRNENTA